MLGKFMEKLAGGSKKLSGKTDLLEGICSMAALVACADGDIEDSEVESALNALQSHETLSGAFSSTQIEQALDKQLKRAKGGFAGKLALKKEIDEMKSKNPAEELEMAFVIALDVAMSDGELEEAEKKVFDDLGRRLGFSLNNYL